MATQGPFIGMGYIPGQGNVRVFTDMDNPKMLFTLGVRSDRRGYISRDRVKFRKAGKK